MLPVLIQSLVLASAGLFSVGSITIIILLLMSEHGLHNGLAYMLGYMGGYMLIGVSVILVGYRVAENRNPRLLALIDKITPLKAFALGAVITVINFKNLALFLTAVSIPLLSDLSLPQKLIVVILDALVFCTAVIVPVLVYILFPKKADHFLNWIKRALETHSRPIGIWVPLLFGLLFIIRGITGLL